MKANHQFSIAVHLMAVLGSHRNSELTSVELSMSVNTSGSFIRRTLSKLAKAGLVKTKKGKSGSTALAKDPKRISMLDIYEAVEAPQAFAIHQYPAQKACAVSCKFKLSMQNVLAKTQSSMEQTLRKVSLAEVVSDIQK